VTATILTLTYIPLFLSFRAFDYNTNTMKITATSTIAALLALMTMGHAEEYTPQDTLGAGRYTQDHDKESTSSYTPQETLGAGR